MRQKLGTKAHATPQLVNIILFHEGFYGGALVAKREGN
jgi:hypothetical protein